MRIVVSGTPGVGKHTISVELSKLLNGIPIIDINKIILSNRYFIPSNSDEVDLIKTFNMLKMILSEKKYKDVIMVGHLAPYVLDSSLTDFTIVLRRHPNELKKIYEIRSYSETKTRDNLMSEILGIISYDALLKFSKFNIAEIEIKENILPIIYAQKIIDMYENKFLREFGMIDWLSIIQKDPQMIRFYYNED